MNGALRDRVLEKAWKIDMKVPQKKRVAVIKPTSNECCSNGFGD